MVVQDLEMCETRKEWGLKIRLSIGNVGDCEESLYIARKSFPMFAF